MNKSMDAYFRLMSAAGLVRLGQVFKPQGDPVTDDYVWAALDSDGDWFAYTNEPKLDDGVYYKARKDKLARYIACMKEEQVHKPILIGFTDKL